MLQHPSGLIIYATEGLDGTFSINGSSQCVVERTADGQPMFTSGRPDGLPELSQVISEVKGDLPGNLMSIDGSLWKITIEADHSLKITQLPTGYTPSGTWIRAPDGRMDRLPEGHVRERHRVKEALKSPPVFVSPGVCKDGNGTWLRLVRSPDYKLRFVPELTLNDVRPWKKVGHHRLYRAAMPVEECKSSQCCQVTME